MPQQVNSASADPHGEAAAQARGWSSAGTPCEAKTRALAKALVPPSAPLPTVTYLSRGNVVVVGGGALAAAVAAGLAGRMPVTAIAPTAKEGSAVAGALAWTGRVASISGHLGSFTLVVDGLAGATLLSLAAGSDPGAPRPAVFDIVVDCGPEPLYTQHQPPQGYWRVVDAATCDAALAEVPEAVGEFEKPRFFAYRANLCAHARSSITGCSRCIDVCSTRAIAADGDHVKVDPHLCMGCGACASVCPSGAMSFQFPRVADRGDHLRALLAAYREAGGEGACLLFHNGSDGRALLAAAEAEGRGLPGNVIPLESWHVASIGVDLLLGAVALGACQVAVLCVGSEAPAYRDSLREQMRLAQQIVSALGYAGQHFRLIEAADAHALGEAIASLGVAAGPAAAAAFALSNDKRTAVEFAVEHLAKHAPAPAQEIALAAGAPWGEVRVDKDKCTLCLACAGACPASALMDGGESPQLRFLERNCVQCGLCVATCPEDALSLSPRLLLTPAVRETRVLNETTPFHCVSCGKPFGTRQMVDAMVTRLTGHSMFAGSAALKRLQMCGDCRVVDMMSNPNEMTTRDL